MPQDWPHFERGHPVTPIDGVVGKPTLFRKSSRQAFEAATVDFLFTYFRLPGGEKGHMIQRFKERTGEPRLSLYEFHATYPTFPVFFQAYWCGKLTRSLTVSSLFTNFVGQPFTRAYERMQDEVPDDIASQYNLALVFHWPHVAHGLVLHSQPPTEAVGTQMTWLGKDGRQRTLEPLTTLLAGIDRASEHGRWQPE